jgi:hypothetical protein
MFAGLRPANSLNHVEPDSGIPSRFNSTGRRSSDPRATAVAIAAKRLDELRNNWLNPPDLVDIVPEVTPTAAPGEEPRRYPDHIVPKNAEAAVKLKNRTLTNLYNERPR